MKVYTGVLCVLVLLSVLAAGCSTPTPMMVQETQEAAEVSIVEKTVEVESMATEEPTEEPLTEEFSSSTAHVLPAVAARSNRMIIKNSEMQLTVEDTDAAIDLVTQVVGDLGGYIVSSRVWYQDWLEEPYKYASVTIGIPVDRFEVAMRRLRGMAVQVDDESASGQDVTDEYVDLESRLRNLEATSDRIRSFLDQATSVEESLRVNEQLAAIEAEIETVKGRMNYLTDRSAYSTITVQLNPELPPVAVPPTPTPTPKVTPEPWRASAVAADATATLTSILKVLAELVIWFGIVILPLIIPIGLIVWGTRYVLRRLGL